MIKLTELMDESDASDEAKKMGLDYLKFGRYGKDGKVTHVSKNGRLVPADQKRGEPHPSHGAAVRNVTRGRPADEMPEPEYPINWKQGKMAPENDPNADKRITPMKKIPYGDYGGNQPKPKNTSHKANVSPEYRNKLRQSVSKELNKSLAPGFAGAAMKTFDKLYPPTTSAQNTIDPYSEEGYVGALDALSAGVPSDKFADFMKPYLKDPAKSNEFFSSIIDMASDADPDPDGYGATETQNNLINGAGMALKVLRRLSPNVNSLSSMVPNKTPDQLDDPEDFEKNRNLDNIQGVDDEPFVHPDDELYNRIQNSPDAKQKKLQKFVRGK